MLVSIHCLSSERLQHHEGVAVDFCSLEQLDHDLLLLQEMNAQRSKEKDKLLM